MNSFYSETELETLGLKQYGKNVCISRNAQIYSAGQIIIGDNVRIDDFCILSGRICLGNYIHIAAYSGLFAGNSGIEIDDFANISSRVSIYAVSDDYSGESMTNPMISDAYKKLVSRKVTIGKHVIVGSGSVILPGAELLEGCAVGALSLVKNSTEAWNIYAGIPVKKVKQRRQNILELEKNFIQKEH